MKLFLQRISKSQFNNIPENERNFFLFIGHLANEINILQKLTIMCFNKFSVNKAEERAHMAQALLIIKILVGKVWEAWKLITRIFNKDLSRKYEHMLSCEARDALKELRLYFNKKTKTIIYQVRNKFSFHYDPGKIKSIFSKLPDELEMDIYLEDSNANSLYYGSEVFVNLAMLEMIQSGDQKMAIERLMKETTKVADLLINFIGNCMYLFVSNYFLNEKRKLLLDTVDIGQIPSFSEIVIPYFIGK
jgi:hypothetical protein